MAPSSKLLSPFLAITTIMLVPAAAAAQASPDPTSQAFNAAAAQARLDTVLDRIYPELDRIYKDIHAHPEVAMQEVRTAGILAARLRKLGIAVTEKVGTTGVVGVLRNGDGPTILLRADMDALPMEEKTGLPYASRARQVVDGRESFVAHSCGHDVHVTWLIGAAEALVAMQDQWRGTLVFIGQPAEEALGGAKAMLADGLLTRFPKPDYGFAAHVSNLPAGTLTIREGTTSSASDSFDITFHGRGAHGSMPSAAIDPIVIGAHFVSDVQTVVSREKDAAAFGVLTVGAFQAGTVANIIPDVAVLKVNLRSHSRAVRNLLTEGVKRTAKAAADMAMAPPPTVNYLGGTAAMVNDSAMARQAAALFAPLLAERATFLPGTVPPSAASEDFSEFVEAGVPGLFFGIGSYDPAVIADHKARGVPLPVNHSPFFAPQPEPAIRAGVTALVLSIIGGVRPAPDKAEANLGD